MDQIKLSGIQTEAIIGVYDWERKQKRPLILDLTLFTSCQKAGSSDAIYDAIDYQQVTELVTDMVVNSSYKLLEALAENIAALVLEKFAIDKIEVTVHKPKVLTNVEDVKVSIERAK